MAISSIKPATGHMMGASGALEVAICALTLDRGIAPPTLKLRGRLTPTAISTTFRTSRANSRSRPRSPFPSASAATTPPCCSSVIASGLPSTRHGASSSPASDRSRRLGSAWTRCGSPCRRAAQACAACRTSSKPGSRSRSRRISRSSSRPTSCSRRRRGGWRASRSSPSPPRTSRSTTPGWTWSSRIRSASRPSSTRAAGASRRSPNSRTYSMSAGRGASRRCSCR